MIGCVRGREAVGGNGESSLDHCVDGVIRTNGREKKELVDSARGVCITRRCP